MFCELRRKQRHKKNESKKGKSGESYMEIKRREAGRGRQRNSRLRIDVFDLPLAWSCFRGSERRRALCQRSARTF